MNIFAVNPSVFVYFFAFIAIPLIFYAVFCYKEFVVSVQLETAENFSPESENYIKTVAVVKSRNKFFRKSKLCYNVDRKTYFIKVPYYLESDSTNIIYLKDKPNQAILYNCERLKKTVRKCGILANLSIILEFIMIVLTIIMFILLVKSGGDNSVSSSLSY